jgi:aminopeptidase N
VYFKGAYVLHLLREEMGEDAFWKVIKLYSQKYFEKTVQTADFLKIMQDPSDKKLTPFFSKWGYNK